MMYPFPTLVRRLTLKHILTSLVPRRSDCFFLREILLRVRRGMSREAGRRTGSVERLAENAKNMADTTHTSIELCAGMEQLQPLLERINEDERLLLADMHRPIHEAYMLQKILCPIESCVKGLHFFDENGIGHHFRVIHKCDFTKENHQESLRICQKLLEDEITRCFDLLFKQREQKNARIKFVNFINFIKSG